MGGGPCDFGVSPSPFDLDFGTLDFGLGLDNFWPILIRYQDVVSMQSDCSDTGQTASHPWLCSHVATAQSRPGPCLIVSPFVSTCHSPVFSPSLSGILRG